MKIYLLLFFPLLFAIMKFNKYKEPDLVNKLGLELAEYVEKKYSLTPSGIGGSIKENKIQFITVHFCFKGNPVDIETGRKLLLPIVNDLLIFLNDKPEIRQNIQEYPFTSKNLDIAIFFYDFENKVISHPYLNTISARKEEIGYFTRDPHNRYKYELEMYEPYEEALKKVKQHE